MAERRLKVILEAQVDRYKSAMSAAAKSTEALEKAAKEADNTTSKRVKSLRELETPLLAIGTASVAGLGLATKAAMDWESAWAGVMKTVDGTPEQMAGLEEGLRGLARELPITHTELAGVAEAAGQLGVARKDILGFTKTMVDLGVSTNLTAEEAATSIAQISNVMGTMEREGAEGVSRFGAALVELGNNGASTEADILNMAQRIAGAGATVGATETDVLALSNTLASMGIRAELGGGVATRVLLKMRTAVDEGGDSLQTFAKTAGVSAEEFASKFRSSPMEALQLVAGGINNVNEAGGNVTATLKDMGIKGTEETQVMLALANSGDLLTESLKMGAAAWEENTALVAEASQRYETTESKVRIAWNNIKDAAISAGEVILPVVAGIAEGVADAAGAFSALPGPVQGVLTVLGGVAGVGLGALGLFVKFAPAVKNARDALGTFTPAGGRARDTMVGIGKAAGVMTAALAAAATIEMFNGYEGSKASEIEQDLLRIANGAKELAAGDVIDIPIAMGDSIDTLGEAIERVTNKKWDDGVEDFIHGISGGSISTDLHATRDALVEYDTAVANLAQGGNFDAAAAGFREAARAAEEQGVGLDDVAKQFPQYIDHLRNTATELGVTVSQTDLLKWAMDGIAPAAITAADGSSELDGAITEVGDAAGEAAEELDKYFEGLTKTGTVVLTERAAQRELAAAIDAATEARKENGKTLDTDTEKGRANQAALDGIATATMGVRDAMFASGATAGEMAVAVQQGRDAFLEAAVAAGMEADEAARLADAAGLVPANVFTQYESNVAGEVAKISDLHQWIQSTPDKTITISDNTPETKAALERLGYIVTTLPDGRIQVSETGTDATGQKIDATAGKKRTAKINAQAITDAAEWALNQAARDRTSRISQVVSRSVQTTYSETKNYGQGRQQSGGRVLQRRSGGGRLPATGLGIDQILGVDSSGQPTAWVDDREWVINRRSSDKYNRELAMINAGTFPKLPGYASGGQAGTAQGMPYRAADLSSVPQRIINVTYNVTNPVAEPPSKTTENASTHLSLLGGGL